MDNFTTNSFSSKIQSLLGSQVEFPQKLTQHFVFQSDQVSNPFKFIGGLLSKGVLCDGANDSETNFLVKEMMVRLAMMIACAKGAEGIGGLMEALKECGNPQLISDFKDWIKQDFGVEIESNFGQPEEAGSSAQTRKSEVLAAEAREVSEPSSCGAKLVDKIMLRVDDDLMDQLQGHFIGRAYEIVNATEFCSNLVNLKVLDEKDTRLATELEEPGGQNTENLIKAACSKKAIGSLVVAFQCSSNEGILTETYEWLQTSYARKKNYPISVKSLANQQSCTKKSNSLQVGDRIVWAREETGKNEAGLVKWLGFIEGEQIAGIEFDSPLYLGSGWYENQPNFEHSKDKLSQRSALGILKIFNVKSHKKNSILHFDNQE